MAEFLSQYQDMTGLKATTIESFDTDEDKPVSKETGVQDQLVFSANHKVNLRINPETQDVIINIVDSESGEVVRQIPGEGFLELKHRITEFNQIRLKLWMNSPDIRLES